MTKDELKRFVDDRIKEALKSMPPSSDLLHDSYLVRRLERVEFFLRALIVSLREHPHGLSHETIDKTYRRLRSKQNRDDAEGIAEFLALLERDERNS